jgi:hypothetical protein
MSALSDAAGICPHQLAGLFCKLLKTWQQDANGNRKDVMLPCKEWLGGKCPFGFGGGKP